MTLLRAILVVLLVPMLVTGVAAPAFAQDSSAYLRQLRGADIPLSEAQFLLYQYMAGTTDAEPDERLLAQVRTELGFGNARFYALLDHMRESIESSRSFADARNAELCERREQLTTVKALGAALDAAMAALRAHQGKLVEAAAPILGAEGEIRFASMLSEYRERMVVNRVDYTALLEARQIDAGVAIGDICRQVAEAEQAAVEHAEAEQARSE